MSDDDLYGRFKQWMSETLGGHQDAPRTPPAAAPVPVDAEATKRSLPGYAGQETDTGGQMAPDRRPVQKVDTPWLSRNELIELDDEPQEPMAPVWSAAERAGKDFATNHPDATKFVGDAIWKAQQAGREADLRKRQDMLQNGSSTVERAVMNHEAPESLQKVVDAAKQYFAQPSVRQPIQIDRSDDKAYAERVRQAIKNAEQKK